MRTTWSKPKPIIINLSPRVNTYRAISLNWVFKDYVCQLEKVPSGFRSVSHDVENEISCVQHLTFQKHTLYGKVYMSSVLVLFGNVEQWVFPFLEYCEQIATFHKLYRKAKIKKKFLNLTDLTCLITLNVFIFYFAILLVAHKEFSDI